MESIISEAITYVQAFFANECSGHDAFHSLRVYHTALYLAEQENADRNIVALAALLHDVDDIKLSPDTCEKKEHATQFLQERAIAPEIIESICTIIEEVSFKGTDSVTPLSIEGKCVQDADRLDALGAIGIARAFAYGGAHGRMLYHPDIVPRMNMDEATYRKHVSTTVNHFYEKLFLLQGKMNTDTAKRIAKQREQYMKEYITRFLQEWDGIDLL